MVSPELLRDVKTFFGITWDDQATDARYRSMIESGMVYLDDKRGGYCDYMQPSPSRTLLFEYVRYDRDHALDVFENNYRSQILALQNERRVSTYVEEALSPDCL